MRPIHWFVSQLSVSVPNSGLLPNLEGERGCRPFLRAFVAVRNDHEHWNSLEDSGSIK